MSLKAQIHDIIRTKGIFASDDIYDLCVKAIKDLEEKSNKTIIKPKRQASKTIVSEVFRTLQYPGYPIVYGRMHNICKLIDNSQRLAAVKEFKDYTGLGLKEAKEHCDKIWEYIKAHKDIMAFDDTEEVSVKYITRYAPPNSWNLWHTYCANFIIKHSDINHITHYANINEIDSVTFDLYLAIINEDLPEAASVLMTWLQIIRKDHNIASHTDIPTINEISNIISELNTYYNDEIVNS